MREKRWPRLFPRGCKTGPPAASAGRCPVSRPRAWDPGPRRAERGLGGEGDMGLGGGEARAEARRAAPADASGASAAAGVRECRERCCCGSWQRGGKRTRVGMNALLVTFAWLSRPRAALVVPYFPATRTYAPRAAAGLSAEGSCEGPAPARGDPGFRAVGA